MAADSDEEQIETLKKWIRENGASTAVSIAIALLAVFGYRTWEGSVQRTGEAASAIYEDLLPAVEQATVDANMLATSQTLVETLKKDYANTAYAIFGALQLARIEADQGNVEGAAKELQWALDADPDKTIEPMIRVRLARMLGEQKKYDEALAVLSARIDKGAWVTSWEEARGDILYAKGDEDGAREAYQLAVNALGDGNRPYLTMKLQDLTYARPIAAEPATAAGDDGSGAATDKADAKPPEPEA